MALSLCVVCIHSFGKQIIDWVETHNTAASTLFNTHNTATGTCVALHLRTFKCEEFKKEYPIAALQNLTSLGDSLLYILNNVNNITADKTADNKTSSDSNAFEYFYPRFQCSSCRKSIRVCANPLCLYDSSLLIWWD